jgi:Tfp pilus assembly protein PilN
MKKINLINALSPHKQYEIYRWFWMTIFLSVCAIIIGSYFIVPQIITYRRLKKDSAGLINTTQEHATLTSTKDVLKKEYDELYTRESKINNYKQQKKNPYSHITEIVHLCGATIQLQSIKLNKKEIEIEIVCDKAENAHALIKSLSTLPYFSHLKIVSLQQDMQTKQIRCAIKGNVIF